MSADRHVFLGQPGYGEVTGGAAGAFWRATRLPDKRVCRQYQEGSLLAANFNALWCAALNLARTGRRLSHFAMLHADVEPEDYWLDTLLDELEAQDLDVLGAVVPIKDPHGLTSLALGRPDGDPWRPLCRLTLAEVYRLPPTFTSADVGHPLLLNTGCWVCRFDERWARQVHFTVNDRIIVGADGAYHAQCESEDWYFSRLCHELGLRVGATRKVRLTHRGPAAFTNAHPWGEPFDAAWTDRSPLPLSADPFILPDLDGWLTYDEGKALADRARDKRVLEIGSYCGLSTVCLARAARYVVAVNPFDGRGTPRPGATFGAFTAALDRFGVTDRVEPLVGTLADPDVRRLAAEHGPYDLVFIDGAHDYESVRADIGGALEQLAPGGLLAFHDYRVCPGECDGRWDPGVTRAVDELVAAGGDILARAGSLAVVRPPSPLELSAFSEAAARPPADAPQPLEV